MKKVERAEVKDYQTYTDKRDEFRRQVMVIKEQRRIHLGPNLTFLFENKYTMLYQIQEMMRIERIVKESDVCREIETYNELLGGAGELATTLLIEIPDEEQRDKLLREWWGLEKHIYMLTEAGEKVYATYDKMQVGGDRLSAVQYLKFAVGEKVPEKIGCDFKDYNHEIELTDIQWKALHEDL